MVISCLPLFECVPLPFRMHWLNRSAGIAALGRKRDMQARRARARAGWSILCVADARSSGSAAPGTAKRRTDAARSGSHAHPSLSWLGD